MRWTPTRSRPAPPTRRRSWRRSTRPSRWSSRRCGVPDDVVIDAHTHLGLDEDGQSLDPDALLRVPGPGRARRAGLAFPFHDPDRSPPTAGPTTACSRGPPRAAGGSFPTADWTRPRTRRPRPNAAWPRRPRHQAAPARPGVRVRERRRRSDLRGRKMPRSRSWSTPAAGCRRWTLADLARRFPTCARPGTRRACRSGHVRHRLATIRTSSTTRPASRCWTSSSCSHECPPSGSCSPPTSRTAGRSAGSTPRCAWRAAGLDADERALVTGGTMAAGWMAGRWPTRPPRLDRVRSLNGTMLRIAGYLMMGFGAAISGGERARGQPCAAEAIALARGVCRDPDAGVDGPRDRPDRRDPGRGRAQLRRSRHGLDDPRRVSCTTPS